MNGLVVITIDSEIDLSPNWDVSVGKTFMSIVEGIPKKLQPLFSRFGAKPTYLLSSEVIDNPDCVRLLKSLTQCELGTHLHGELVPPQLGSDGTSNKRTFEMQSSYPREIEQEKLSNLTKLFTARFGFEPTSFRAGRFGAGNNTIPLLEKLGYLVDSSITPGILWRHPEGESNFIAARGQPYFPSLNNILVEGESKVLEVPVSINSSKFRKYLRTTGKSRLARPYNMIIERIFPVSWLRPSFQSTDEMLSVMEKLLRKFQSNHGVVLNMMFHSMEVWPNASPYTKTEEECQAFLNRIEHILSYCVENSFKFVTLSELYPMFANRVTVS